ncbi:MAG: M28 family metallopeptidase [Pseudomarimonas sp.]
MRIVLTSLACAITALVAACQPATTTPAEEAPTAVAPTAVAGNYSFGPEISAEDVIQHVKVLASDEFEGRAPGGKGEQLTVDYLVEQFKRLGLKPGNGDSYTQSVPMVSTTADPSTELNLKHSGGNTRLAPFTEMVIGTSSGNPRVLIEDSEMVFVGYGVNAPESNWNDYSIDVRGKTVVMLVNDPGFHVGNEELFLGKRMTYYGRWSYKFEEAARQGAAAALIIHDTEGAGYGWNVIGDGWKGAQFDLPATEDSAPRLPAQGWLTAEAANAMFERAGLDFNALRTAANQPGFKPVPLATTLSLDLKSEISASESRNVVALLPGASRPDESIIYMAHWDHLGIDPTLTGDTIYNGASDNATGVAGILEIAERFVTRETPPARSVLFAAVTLEESGLLGSKFYVAHPLLPLEKTVAVVNLDNLPAIGRSRDITVIGMGNSELEDLLRPIAERQARILRPESAPEKGFYFRSDHFNFAKAGVPALYAKGGADHFEKGEVYGLQAQTDYVTQRYHQPSDEYDDSWDLSGMVEDMLALYQLGNELANGEQWPNWYEGNAFKAARDASAAARVPATPPATEAPAKQP